MKKEESKVIAQKFQKIPNGTLAMLQGEGAVWNLLKFLSYRSKISKDSKRHPRLEALPGWRNGYHTLWRTVSSGYRWKRRGYGGI